MAHFTHALLRDEQQAEAAVEALIDGHYRPQDVSVLLCDGGSLKEAPIVHHTGMGHDAARGVALGALVGATLSATGVVGVLAAGPLLAALEVAVVGGATGGLVGVLTGLGYWQSEAEFPETHLREGGILVGVLTDRARAPDAERILRDAGGSHVGTTDQKPRPEAAQELHTRR